MKTLYWKTRPLRLTPTGGRSIHWPGLALNLSLALVLVAVPVFGFVLIDLEFNLTEALPLWLLALPIVLTLGLALTALGFGYCLTAPLDCLPGENGEPAQQKVSTWPRWDCTRAVLFGVLASITVLLLARTLSDWQGRRAWEAYRADAEKRGVVFDLEKLMPPPVPDAENFAATPLLRPFQSGTSEFDRRRTPDGKAPPGAPFFLGDPKVQGSFPSQQNWLLGQRADLAAWQSHYRTSTNFPKWPEPRSPSEDVLKALTRYEQEISELQSASVRPRSQFSVQLTEDGIPTLLPHLQALRAVGNIARLRAIAKLQAGGTDAASLDTQLVLRFGDALRGEPVLISHLVRIALHTSALEIVWEGLADHRWTNAQLAHWQKELARHDFAAELRHAMAGEQAFGNRAVAFIRRRPEMLDALGGDASGDPPGIGKVMSPLAPPGWLCVEQINLNRAFEEFIMGALPTGDGRFDPVLIRSKDAAMMGYFARHSPGIKAALRHTILSRMFLPALTGAISKACRAQVFTQLAIAACALERHWLARGSYPESLAALAPEFGPLPPDPMSGQPFRYERTADGRFRLWSIGWNGKDDGGTVALTGTPASKSRNINFEQGDWVWPVPQQ